MLEKIMKHAKKIGLTALTSAILITPIDASSQTNRSSKIPGLAPVYKMNPITMEINCPDWKKIKEISGIRDGYSGISKKGEIITEIPSNCTATITAPIYTTGTNGTVLKNDLLIKTADGKKIKNPYQIAGKSEYAFDMKVMPDTVGMKKGPHHFSVAVEQPGNTTNSGILSTATFTAYVIDPTNNVTSTYNNQNQGANDSTKNEEKKNDDSQDKNTADSDNKKSGNNKNNSNQNNLGNNTSTTLNSSMYQLKAGVTSTSQTYDVEGDPKRTGIGFSADGRILKPKLFASVTIDGSELEVTDPNTGRIFSNQNQTDFRGRLEYAIKSPLIVTLSGSSTMNSYANVVNGPNTSSTKFGIGAGARLGNEKGFVSVSAQYSPVTQTENTGSRSFSTDLKDKAIVVSAWLPIGKAILNGHFSSSNAKDDAGIYDVKTSSKKVDLVIPIKNGIGGYIGASIDKFSTKVLDPKSRRPVTTESSTSRYVAGISFTK